MFRWIVHLKGGPKRADLVAVAVGNKEYSFGGYYCPWENSQYMFNMGQIEVHVFNTLSLRWMKLPPVITRNTVHPIEVPAMRLGHTATLIDDIIYIWGGETSIEEYCNVLYAFDVNTHRWFKPKISGTVPGARRDHSACVLGKVMYIFGGSKELTIYTNDIYNLDTTTMVWCLINTRGSPTPVSARHSATIIGAKMFVFGGRGDRDEDYYNIRVFDTETNCWLCKPSEQLLPEGRMCHSAFAYNGELYIFGGYNFLPFSNLRRKLNDLWKFNPETFSWKKIEPKGKGPYSWQSSMCCCRVGDHILFGGYTRDDLYILDLSPSLKTLCKLAVIQYSLEQWELPHNIRWELAAMTSNSNRKKCDNNGSEQVPGNGTEERERQDQSFIQIGKKAE